MGVTELLFTSDNGTGIQKGHIPGGISTFFIQLIARALLVVVSTFYLAVVAINVAAQKQSTLLCERCEFLLG